jgi:hypothetical protein
MKNQISIQMSGRLGNQLFQWALGHKLAIHYEMNTHPLYDSIHEHKGYESNISNLSHSCSHLGEAVRSDSTGLLLSFLDKINSKNQRLGSLINRKLRILRTKEFYCIPEFPKKAPRLVTGFYTNWKTVEGIESILAVELNAALKLVALPVSIQGEYQILHVRRGDFVSLRDSFGLLSAKYYSDNLVTGLPTYICTDDEGLVPEIANITKAIKVFGPNELNPIQSLKIMSEASVLVMSNSTLAWWGGFLCSTNGGIVSLPKPFYKSLDSKSSIFDYPKFKICMATFES